MLIFSAEKVKAKDLQPGDLFSNRGMDYWGHTTIGAVGERVFIRTDNPGPEDQDEQEIYRITYHRGVIEVN